MLIDWWLFYVTLLYSLYYIFKKKMNKNLCLRERNTSTPESASAPYQFCPLLSRFEPLSILTAGHAPAPSSPLFSPPPQNCSFTRGYLDHHLIDVSLDPAESTSKTSRLVQSFLQWADDRDIQTDGQTDHATPSVVIACIYIVLRCDLIITRKYAAPGSRRGMGLSRQFGHKLINVLLDDVV